MDSITSHYSSSSLPLGESMSNSSSTSWTCQQWMSIEGTCHSSPLVGSLTITMIQRAGLNTWSCIYEIPFVRYSSPSCWSILWRITTFSLRYRDTQIFSRWDVMQSVWYSSVWCSFMYRVWCSQSAKSRMTSGHSPGSGRRRRETEGFLKLI